MSIDVSYSPQFVRSYKKMSDDLQEEIYVRIEEFKNSDNHKKLKVHKLKGPLAKLFSFSVNYKYRIVFEYVSKQEAFLHMCGSHDVYR